MITPTESAKPLRSGKKPPFTLQFIWETYHEGSGVIPSSGYFKHLATKLICIIDRDRSCHLWLPGEGPMPKLPYGTVEGYHFYIDCLETLAFETIGVEPRVGNIIPPRKSWQQWIYEESSTKSHVIEHGLGIDYNFPDSFVSK